MTTSWTNVSASSPCPKCGKPDWCRVRIDGVFCACRRSAEGGQEKVDKSGATFYLHRLIESVDRNINGQDHDYPQPKYHATDGDSKKADADTCHKVYSTMVSFLGLNGYHAADLIRRGVGKTREEVDAVAKSLGYGTLGKSRLEVAAKVVKAGLEQHLPYVPGFYTKGLNNDRQCWSIAGLGGMMIPVRDVQRRIVAMVVRVDDPGSGGKYRYLSSRKRGGAGPGAPTHIPLFDGNTGTVRVTEGVLKADIATRLSGILTIGLAGVGRWRQAANILKSLETRFVRVAFDADAQTNSVVAEALKNLIGDLRVKGFVVDLETWDSSLGKGIDDVLTAGHEPTILRNEKVDQYLHNLNGITDKSKKTSATDAKSVNIGESVNVAEKVNESSVRIEITTEECTVNNQAIQALSHHPSVYQRAGMLVTTRCDTSPYRAIHRPNGSPFIAPISYPLLRDWLTKVAEFGVFIGSEEGEKWKPKHPPVWCVNALIARGFWAEIRHLTGIVEVPTLRPDGTILEKPGWDPATGLLYEPSCEFPPVPENPSRVEAEVAADLLIDLVGDFPFVDNRHGLAWLAGLLTLLARHAFAGPSPCFLVDANVAGSGKSKLTDVVAILATGRPMPRTPYAEDPDEQHKMITSVALAGDRCVLIDNIATAFGGPSLDAALTSTTWRSRILGKSEMTAELPLTVVWFATGNNVSLKGDITRRILPCRLESPEENPENRQHFKYPRLLDHVLAGRPRLVVAALTILRGYFAAGCPDQKLSAFGSFEGWSDLVRSAIHWVYGIDCCETRQGLAIDDPKKSELVELLEGWSELPGGTNGGVTVADAIRYLKAGQDGELNTLRNVVMGWSRNGVLPSENAVAYRLRSVKGQVASGRSLKTVPARAGVVAWRVEGKNQ